MGKVSVELLAVNELLAKNLNIPNYQRPYVWEEKQVLQLLDDIWENCCADKKEYRIGSVILHSNNNELDIVDGQQRITTLLIILTLLEERIVITDTNEVIDLTYTHTESQKHIRANAITIDTWIAENADKKVFIDFLKNKCKFAVITVEKLSEAFQMFESQNGRGKELEAYNLLKAYHLRAMEEDSQNEKIHCDVRWERAARDRVHGGYVDLIKQVMDEQLYRSRLWMKGRIAGKFSKEKIDEFKGFSVKDTPARYPYQNRHFFFWRNLNKYQKEVEQNPKIRNQTSEHEISPYCTINQTIIDGKPFFDYVETYVGLYRKLFVDLSPTPFDSDELIRFKKFYYQYCLCYSSTNDYENDTRWKPFVFQATGAARRTGDGYLRELYKSALLAIFDKFGEEGLLKYYAILYKIIYVTRVIKSSVRYKTVSHLGKDMGIFEKIGNAKSLSDLRSFQKILIARKVEMDKELEKTADEGSEQKKTLPTEIKFISTFIKS